MKSYSISFNIFLFLNILDIECFVKGMAWWKVLWKLRQRVGFEKNSLNHFVHTFKQEEQMQHLSENER